MIPIEGEEREEEDDRALAALGLAATIAFTGIARADGRHELRTTHATSTCFAQIGTLTVSKTGSGTANYSIPFTSLRCTGFGAGDRTDHFGLISSQNVDSSLAAGPITYTVPAGSCPATAARTAATGDANT